MYCYHHGNRCSITKCTASAPCGLSFRCTGDRPCKREYLLPLPCRCVAICYHKISNSYALHLQRMKTERCIDHQNSYHLRLCNNDAPCEISRCSTRKACGNPYFLPEPCQCTPIRLDVKLPIYPDHLPLNVMECETHGKMFHRRFCNRRQPCLVDSKCTRNNVCGLTYYMPDCGCSTRRHLHQSRLTAMTVAPKRPRDVIMDRNPRPDKRTRRLLLSRPSTPPWRHSRYRPSTPSPPRPVPVMRVSPSRSSPVPTTFTPAALEYIPLLEEGEIKTTPHITETMTIVQMEEDKEEKEEDKEEKEEDKEEQEEDKEEKEEEKEKESSNENDDDPPMLDAQRMMLIGIVEATEQWTKAMHKILSLPPIPNKV